MTTSPSLIVALLYYHESVVYGILHHNISNDAR